MAQYPEIILNITCNQKLIYEQAYGKKMHFQNKNMSFHRHLKYKSCKHSFLLPFPVIIISFLGDLWESSCILDGGIEWTNTQNNNREL